MNLCGGGARDLSDIGAQPHAHQRDISSTRQCEKYIANKTSANNHLRRLALRVTIALQGGADALGPDHAQPNVEPLNKSRLCRNATIKAGL